MTPEKSAHVVFLEQRIEYLEKRIQHEQDISQVDRIVWALLVLAAILAGYWCGVSL